jgi:glycosyltransferase involved in cell wall biosynthesis
VTSVCIVSPAHGRSEITRLVLAQRRRLAEDLANKGFDVRLLIAADDENVEIAEEFGCDVVRVLNNPLGRKANVALAAAAATGAGWIVWVGSDDWIHPDAFDPLHVEYERPVIVRGKRLSIVDTSAGMLQQISSPSAYGAIPWLIDARLFHVTEINPIRSDRSRGLDGALARGLQRHRIPFEFVTHDPHPFRCVDFKTAANLWPFEFAAGAHALDEPEPAWTALANWFPADLVNQARRLSEGVTVERSGSRRHGVDPGTGQLARASSRKSRATG